jgi:selenide,water dikinase
MAGKRIGEVSDGKYQAVLDSMKQLNAAGAEIMQKYDVKCATDITGFGLAGHALKLAKASNVSLYIDNHMIPLFDGAKELAELGCIPGACFRNMDFSEHDIEFSENLSYEQKMLMMDAQTSGGLLICCTNEKKDNIINDLRKSGFEYSSEIGNVRTENKYSIFFK